MENVHWIIANKYYREVNSTYLSHILSTSMLLYNWLSPAVSLSVDKLMIVFEYSKIFYPLPKHWPHPSFIRIRPILFLHILRSKYGTSKYLCYIYLHRLVRSGAGCSPQDSFTHTSRRSDCADWTNRIDSKSNIPGVRLLLCTYWWNWIYTEHIIYSFCSQSNM